MAALYEDSDNDSEQSLPARPSSRIDVARRHIFSPIPHPNNPADAIEQENLYELSPQKSPLSSWSMLVSQNHREHKTSATPLNSGTTSFPAITIECCDSDHSSSGISKLAEDVTVAGKDTSTARWAELQYRDCLDKERSSLLVPSTLVRRKSTDGRLMVGMKDHVTKPSLLNLSKAWSRSEGNIPGLTTSLQTDAHSTPLTGRTNKYNFNIGHRGSPRQPITNNNYAISHDDCLILGKDKPVLEPIKQNNNNNQISNINNNDNKPEIIQRENSNSSEQLINLLDSSDYDPLSTNFNNLYISKVLKSDDCLLTSRRQYCGTPAPKARAKSISPRRIHQLEPLCLPEVPAINSSGANDANEDTQRHRKDARKSVRFLSPQPSTRLSPLFRDNP